MVSDMTDEQCRRVAEAFKEYSEMEPGTRRREAWVALEQSLKPPSGVPSDQEIWEVYSGYDGRYLPSARAVYLKAYTDLRQAWSGNGGSGELCSDLMAKRIAELEARE